MRSRHNQTLHQKAGAPSLRVLCARVGISRKCLAWDFSGRSPKVGVAETAADFFLRRIILRSNEGRFAPMSRPPYRALRIILSVFSAFAAVGGLFMIFASKPLIMRMFLRPPEAEVSTLLLFVLKEMGGLVLMLSLLF